MVIITGVTEEEVIIGTAAVEETGVAEKTTGVEGMKAAEEEEDMEAVLVGATEVGMEEREEVHHVMRSLESHLQVRVGVHFIAQFV